MTKTTKRPLPVSKTIQFQQHQKIKDISVSGKDALTSVDFSERDGDFKLKVKADPDKLNEVSGTPFVTTTVTTADEGTDDPKKSVALGHDYRGLNVETAGKYLSINKTKEKAVIDGTLIEQDLTKALNDAKEAKDKADKAAEKAGLADQKATTAITQIADVKDALAKLQEASEGADKLLKTDIDNIREILSKLPKDAKLYVSEESRDIAKKHNGRVEGLKRVELYTDLDNSNAVSLSVSDNVTLTVALKQNDNSIDSLDFSREVSEIRLEVAKPALPDFDALGVAVQDAQHRAAEAQGKANEAKAKADTLETSFRNVTANLQDYAMDEAKLNSLTSKLETTTTTANTAKDSADTATALAQQAKETADKTAADLGLAQAKEIADIKNVNDAVERLRTAFGQQNGKLQGRLSELAQKIAKANEGATAPEPLKVDDATYNAIKAHESNPYQLVKSATFIVNGQNVVFEVGDLNEVANFDTSIEGRVLTENPRSNVSGSSNSLIIGLKGDTHEVQSIKIDSGHRDIEKRLLGVRDWLNFVPTKAEKALLQLSQAGGRTNFTQEQLDQGIVVSEGIMVDMGKYWLPVGSVELAFGGDKPTVQELLDFEILIYDLEDARVKHIKANTLIEPGTKVPPILKTVY